MLFAAGLGTRLRPLTNDRPKALVEVNGVPLLEIAIRRLIAAGCEDIIVNVHHFADLVIEFLRSKKGSTPRTSRTGACSEHERSARVKRSPTSGAKHKHYLRIVFLF